MKISYNWLKSYIKELPSPKELENIFTFHVCEVEEVQELPTDTIFDIKILPDRAGDLLCHLGVARELSGLLGIPFVDPTQYYKIPTPVKTNLHIDIETPKCRRYMGGVVRNVSVGPSPKWIVDYLTSIGQRSINNIVDATNIVMYDCGHPVHAFDLKKLTSENIAVKESIGDFQFPVVGSENIVAQVKTGDLVICNGDTVIALAGIKGGTNSGISIDRPYSTDIILEVANFDPVSVRKTGQRLSLLSDARKRFENNVPQELGQYAMRELLALILEMCPEAIFEESIDVYPAVQQKKQISFTTSIISEKLGIEITPASIAKILQDYQYPYVEENGNFIVHIPFWRQDITGIHDMVEEIGRVYGYDKIIAKLPIFPVKTDDDITYMKINAVKKYLIDSGYSEVMTYTFCKKGDIEVARGPKGKEYLRTNLIDGIKESFEKNRLNGALLATTDVKIFEVGTVFTKDEESVHVCLATKKGVEECTLDEFITKNNIPHQEDERLIDISTKNQKFIQWSDYPFIFRDISFWSDAEMKEQDFVSLIKSQLTSLCVKGPTLIDSFEKEGKFSYAFRFVFQSYEKTLTDSDIDGEWNNLLNILKKEGWKVR